MYRALTWLALEREIDLRDEEALARLAEDVSITVDPAPPRLVGEAGLMRVDGIDVTEQLRSTHVEGAVSLVARVPAVRTAMVALQRELAAQDRVVMAGRDIGTVVLPDAPLKVYLDASPEERARRRYEELRTSGRDVTLQQVQDGLARRDAIDSERPVSPLRPAEDAVIIDTDHLSLDQVVERILELVSCRS
jgi:cytidylate kinase